MLTEALTALAAAGGTAVVQAAGTDVWAGCRQRVARLLGRGDTDREQDELDQLDQTAAALEAAGSSGAAERTRNDQEAVWRTRFEALLLSLHGVERERAAAELRALTEERAAAGGLSVFHNTYYGPTASQTGDHNEQTNHFGSSA
ncbi:hypothetical protein ACFV20_33855 [Streptomyces sp. NPDC059696]|uniref:hypothetical protein n=1 Tax=Streptomyces sp. NPDC059696 TaxID=3346911 RepID=UPI00369F1CE4